MSRSGLKNREKIHLSQKKTCGRIDRGAGVYGGCHALEEGSYHGMSYYCHLGFEMTRTKQNEYVPLEPCLKPITTSQFCYARELLKDKLWRLHHDQH